MKQGHLVETPNFTESLSFITSSFDIDAVPNRYKKLLANYPEYTEKINETLKEFKSVLKPEELVIKNEDI